MQKKIWMTLAILWVLSIFATSSTVMTTGNLVQAVHWASHGRVSESWFRMVWQLIWWLVVKGWHATEFGILYLLVKRAKPVPESLSLLIPALYAILDEGHQIFVPLRGCRASDVLTDWLGIAVTFAISSWAANRKKPPIEKPNRVLSHPGFWPSLILAYLILLFLLSNFPFGLITLNQTGGGL